jgi:hypothetical protein
MTVDDRSKCPNVEWHFNRALMQIIISAICTHGGSLREAIGNDQRLEKFGLRLDKMQTPGRHPGWLKLHSAQEERGAINVVWDAQAHILTARVVTRRTNRPSPIVGDFITYLLARRRTRIRAITTAVKD